MKIFNSYIYKKDKKTFKRIDYTQKDIKNIEKMNKRTEDLLEKVGYNPQGLINIFYEEYGMDLGWIAVHPPELSLKQTCYNMFSSELKKMVLI